GVAAARKDEARSNVTRALRECDFGRREVVVRINSLLDETGKRDLADVVPARPDGICLPKVESRQEVAAADAALFEIEVAHRLHEGEIRLFAMIESARGALKVPEIADASARMAGLIFGSADYVKDVRCRPGPERAELLVVMQRIVLAARAARLDAIDAPCFNV